jgi:hypothetical protein
MKQIIELSVIWKPEIVPPTYDPTQVFLTPSYETEHGVLIFLIWGTTMYRIIPMCNIIQASSRWVDEPLGARS